MYERGPLARLGGEPEAVARTIVRATARRAPVRVRVTPSAHLLVLQRRLLPRPGLGPGAALAVPDAGRLSPACPRSR